MTSVLKPSEGMAINYASGAFDIVGKIDVPLVSLDDALSNTTKINLLKLDVQGFESEVFLGAKETLEKTDAVLLEINYVTQYENASNFEDVYTIMRKSGFWLAGVSQPYGNCESGPLWADAMFLRK